MNLRQFAEADLAFTLEDDVLGFGVVAELEDPAGNKANFKTQTGDISQTIDPDTGELVMGQLPHITFRTQTLIDNTVIVGLPVGVIEETKKPWIVRFDDINGNSFVFKIVEASPDRTLGVITCILDLYDDTQ